MDLVTTPRAPEDIFPLEVWELILDHLTSPSDLINCTKVCKAWDKLLELKKITFLMPKVFPILNKYLESLEHQEQDNEDENEEENPITTILKMRLVSHGWKEAVDSYLQNNHPVNAFSFEELTLEFIGNDEPVPYSPYEFGVGGMTSESVIAKLESFLGKGFSPDINPFITREVCYCEHFDNELDQRRLKTTFKNMLKAFGSHIWTCELMFRTHTNRARFYKFVGKYLRLMPNLRSLQLRYYGRICNVRRRTNSETEELDMLLKNEPLPRLEHLTTLEMMYVPYPLSVGLLATNGHLHNLSIHHGDFDDDVLLPDYIANLHIPNLKLLRFPWCQQDLCTFSKVGWPIKELILNVNIGTLSNVFQAVSSTFSNTLEHFALCYNDMIENNEKLQQTRLELPKLKKFRLEIIPFKLETIDFLQGCTALQEIQLAFKVPEDYEEYDDDSLNSSSTDEEDNAVIEFKHCITSMNRSNIWRILKNLQSIKLKLIGIENCSGYIEDVTIDPDKIRKFTRHQFEKYCKAK